MIAITVDDERPMLAALTAAVSASPDIASVTEFSTCSAALEWAEKNPADVAFLDISMRGMGGLKLAEKLMELHPDCKIIFCTGYTQYALDAIQLHVSGYLLKPVTAEAVQKELDHIKGRKAKKKLLTVRCFGSFEAAAQGEPLRFRRSRSKELLAVLIDRRGAGITAKEICAIMWQDSGSENKNINYLHQLFFDLRRTLELAGAAAVLQQNGYTYALDTERIDCDYYSYLDTGRPEFHGEYMHQYSWAESTTGLLSSK
ncbi:MAG: response regulator [Anaerovoracaceae bacterium]